jgi:hypothetical protein
MLEEIVRNHLKHQHEQLLEKGQLPTRDKLRECYANFRGRFAPEKLLQLDGEELLNTIHARGNRDSLVYWLEFKNDDEFPEFLRKHRRRERPQIRDLPQERNWRLDDWFAERSKRNFCRRRDQYCPLSP